MYSGEAPRDRLVASAVSHLPASEPIVVVNLLRFRQTADYTGRVLQCVLLQAFFHLPSNLLRHLAPGRSAISIDTFPYLAACKTYFGELADNPRGQKILYLAKNRLPLRVPEEQAGYWHAVVLGRYPSFEVTMTYQQSDVYKNTSGYHRDAALEDNQLFVTAPIEVAWRRISL